MISVDHVVFQNLIVTRSGQTIFNGISGRVRQGAVIGFWGANGSGKTTLLQILARWRDEFSGQVTWPSNCVNQLLLIPTNTEQLLFPWYKVGKNLAVFQQLAEQRGYEQTLLESEKQRLSQAFDLTKFLDSSVHNLSSGYKARLAIACGLLFRPSVLMLDELFMHIDWLTQKELAACLREELKQRVEMSLILVAHSASPILSLASEIWMFGNKTELQFAAADTFLEGLKSDISRS